MINLGGVENVVKEDFDIVETQAIVLSKVKNDSKAITELTSKINLSDVNTVLTFGKEAAEEISKCSDSILRSVEIVKINDAGQMMVSLGKVMDKFDSKDLSETERKGFFAKIFVNVQKQLDEMLNKYNTMGDEVDKIFIELKTYEKEIGDSNNKLEELYEHNIEYFKLLTQYIVAGEEGIKQIDNHKVMLEKQLEETGDNSIQFQIQNVEQGKVMLEQRVQDLRMAENVALQSLPMIKSMQFGNMNLMRKINSAFIITLPVFKQSLAQAILLKRQSLQVNAMKELDERTNEMLLRNAKNTVEQTKLTTQLSSGTSVKMETLEQTWKIIVEGIEETKKIQDDASKKREEDKIKLESMKEEFVTRTKRLN